MTDKPYYEEASTSARLQTWILGQMMKGAGYAAAVLVAIGLMIYAIYLIGLLLPPESKTAPSPYSLMQTAPDAPTALV